MATTPPPRRRRHLAEGCARLHGKPIKVSVLYPGYIASEMNEARPPSAMLVSTEKGVAMVDAIEKEKASACVRRCRGRRCRVDEARAAAGVQAADLRPVSPVGEPSRLQVRVLGRPEHPAAGRADDDPVTEGSTVTVLKRAQSRWPDGSSPVGSTRAAARRRDRAARGDDHDHPARTGSAQARSSAARTRATKRRRTPRTRRRTPRTAQRAGGSKTRWNSRRSRSRSAAGRRGSRRSRSLEPPRRRGGRTRSSRASTSMSVAQPAGGPHPLRGLPVPRMSPCSTASGVTLRSPSQAPSSRLCSQPVSESTS